MRVGCDTKSEIDAYLWLWHVRVGSRQEEDKVGISTSLMRNWMHEKTHAALKTRGT